jgi:hypothetical protein
MIYVGCMKRSWTLPKLRLPRGLFEASDWTWRYETGHYCFFTLFGMIQWGLGLRFESGVYITGCLQNVHLTKSSPSQEMAILIRIRGRIRRDYRIRADYRIGGRFLDCSVHLVVYPCVPPSNGA